MSALNKPRALRADIQALRTIAVLSVVVFHFWSSLLPGGFVGVDIFFVISGFLITSHLLRDASSGTFSVLKFWARRVRRLLPASFTVLAFIAIFVVLVVPMSLWQQWLTEVQTSMLYVENWKLSFDAVDYLALENTASPTQHFWSLSAEEQFYMIWPLLIALSLLFAKNNQKSARRNMFASLVLVTLASFVYSIYLTNVDAASAYFVSPVRAWEFGAGALLAFMPSRAKQSNLSAILGLGAIALTLVSFNTKLPFPGFIASLPVIGTALVINANLQHGLLARVAALRPIQFVGDKSYSIYLWHWPLLVLMPYALGSKLTLATKLLALALTFLLAWLSAKYIEAPFGNSGFRPALKPRVIFAALLSASLVLGGATTISVSSAQNAIAESQRQADLIAQGGVACFGAASVTSPKQPCVNHALTKDLPLLAAAKLDRGIDPKVCGIMKLTDSTPKVCELGDRTSRIHIAAVGESHIGHYVGALLDLAKKNHWALDVIWKPACPFSEAQRLGTAEAMKACASWVKQTEQLIIDKHYWAVVTSQKSGVAWAHSASQNAREVAVNGLVTTWSKLVANSIPLVVIKDNPRPIAGVIECLSSKNAKQCANRRSTAFKFDPQIEAVNLMKTDQVKLVQFDDIFCGASTCLPVIGHAVVYRDDNHLTNTFARTLAPMLYSSISRYVTRF